MDGVLSQKQRLTGEFATEMADEMIEGAMQNLARIKRGNFRVLQDGPGLEVLVVPNRRVLLNMLGTSLVAEVLWFVIRLGMTSCCPPRGKTKFPVCKKEWGAKGCRGFARIDEATNRVVHQARWKEHVKEQTVEYFARGSRTFGKSHFEINRRLRLMEKEEKDEEPTFKPQPETSVTDVDAMNFSLQGRRRAPRVFNRL